MGQSSGVGIAFLSPAGLTSIIVFACVGQIKAQEQPTARLRPTFEVASVRIHKIAEDDEPRRGRWLEKSPTSLTIRNAKLIWCLEVAYNLQEWQIGGPNWIYSERYDILAKVAAPVPESGRRSECPCPPSSTPAKGVRKSLSERKGYNGANTTP